MICAVDDKNIIINIINTDYISAENERPCYPWNQLWNQYTDIEPFDYAKNRYINAAGTEFANRRDEVRWIEIADVTYGFDCAPEDITNFMAAYTPIMVKQDGETGYKVWLDKDKKDLVMLNYAGMKKAYDTVRNSQLAAYAWYEDIKAKLIAVTEAEGKEKLEEVFPIGG
jgi:hypothetical protein